MPGNIITINGVTEYYVGDSKMEALIKFLKENGFKREPEEFKGLVKNPGKAIPVK